MTNFEAVDRFDQAHRAKIENLYWIAGSLENSDLKDKIEEMEDEDFKKCFPEIFNSKHYEEYRNDYEIMQAIVDFRKFGLFAEIHLPECDNFRYEKGKKHPVSWSVHGGICRIEYCYGETLEELMNEIEKSSEKVFEEYVAQDKKKQKSNV